MQNEGYKIHAQPLHFNQIDEVYHRVRSLPMCHVELQVGSKGLALSEALFTVSGLNRSFSCNHVKDGGKYFMYLLADIYC